MAKGHSYVNKQKARAKENGYRASVVAWLRALPPEHAVGAYLASFEPPPGGSAVERTEPGDMKMFARTLARAWSSSGLDPTVSHYLLHAESAGREVWRLYKQRPREASADDAEEGSRCEEEDGGDMAPVRKNAAGDIVRDERRDAHVQAEIVAAQAAAQAVVRDGKTEQQRREEEAAEAAAAEMKRAEAAAAAKSSFVATAFRAPGPKALARLERKKKEEKARRKGIQVEGKKTGKRYKFKNKNFK